jgi:hypothetical protein
MRRDEMSSEIMPRRELADALVARALSRAPRAPSGANGVPESLFCVSL